jgi:hypothetical protein
MTDKPAQTGKERQAALRARKALLGVQEVRGIFLPPELHEQAKALLLKLTTTKEPHGNSKKTHP